jgi:hypothetical protein
VYPLELSIDSAGKWGTMSEEWTAGTVEQDAGTAVTQSSHLILHSRKACSAVKQSEDE